MKYYKKLFVFIFIFVIVMSIFCMVNIHAAKAQLFDLSKWEVVNLDYGFTDPTPNWTIDSTKTMVTQTINSRPSIFLSDIECINNEVNGSFSVNTKEDDDFIGFVFGYKDSGHYYLFDWKQIEQTTAKQGMSVKEVNTNSKLTPQDVWNTAGTENVKVLYHNNIAYNDKTLYNFTLNFTNEGLFTIVMKQGNSILDTITIKDNTYTSGKFGFYNCSQEMVSYQGFTFKNLSPMLEVQSVSTEKVILSWNASDGATNYILKRSLTPGGPYETITTTSAVTYTDTKVTPGATYYYIVSATVNGVEGIPSNEVSAVIPQPTNKLKLVLEVKQQKQLSVSDELSDNADMDWTSSEPSIATVDTNGMVKALKPGNTVITSARKDNSYTETINVLVVDLEYQLAVDLSVGDTCRLTIDDLKKTTTVTWSSYDPAIATVSAKGKVTAVSEGLTYVVSTDKDGKEIGRIYIRVRQ